MTTSTLLVVVIVKVGSAFFLLNVTFLSLSTNYRLFFVLEMYFYVFIAVTLFLGDWPSQVLSLNTAFSRIVGEDMSVTAGVLGSQFPWHYFGG